jgi:hypothetical protein
MLYYDLCDAAGTTTDKDGILRKYELRVAQRWGKGILAGQVIECALMDSEFTYVTMKFNNLEGAVHQPNQNG